MEVLLVDNNHIIKETLYMTVLSQSVTVLEKYDPERTMAGLFVQRIILLPHYPKSSSTFYGYPTHLWLECWLVPPSRLKIDHLRVPPYKLFDMIELISLPRNSLTALSFSQNLPFFLFIQSKATKTEPSLQLNGGVILLRVQRHSKRYCNFQYHITLSPFQQV